MKSRVNEFVDVFPDFHSSPATDQIQRLVYFHTVLEGRESVNVTELERLFDFAGLPIPRNMPKLLAYLCGKGAKLLGRNGEFSLRRHVSKQIGQDMGIAAPPSINGVTAFDFQGRVFSDLKVSALVCEIKKCYANQCWNACGLLIRIVIERTLDSVDPAIKQKVGLKDKINFAKSLGAAFSKSMREALDHLHGAKIVGDIAAHHSKIILEKPDIDVILPAFRMLIKEVKSV